MAWSNLTPAQQTAIQSLMGLICPMMGQLDRDVANSQTALLAVTSDVTSGLSALAASDTIPNPTGLAGAAAPTQAQVNEVLTDLQNIVTAYATTEKRQLRATLCGAPNMISR